MYRHITMLAHSLENVTCHAVLYLVAASGLLVGLIALLSGVAISEGLKQQALASVATGADVYCTWDTFGRDSAIPSERVAELAKIPGVQRCVPRIIGRLQLGQELVVVVGLPLEEMQRQDSPVTGRVPQQADEVLVGVELARSQGLAPDSRIALEAHLVRVFRVAGTTTPASSLWGSKAIVCDLEEARLLFGDQDHVSDVCLFVRAGYEGAIAAAVKRIDQRFRVQTRSLVKNYVLKGITLREGIFSALFLVVMVLAIPSFAVFTFQGYGRRRREIALLKAEGWRTIDVLEMIVLENIVVSVVVASLALTTSYLWVRWLRAPLIAPFFIADLPLFPEIEIPTKFTPLPLALAFVFSIVVTLTGSLYSTWRTAVLPPMQNLQ